MSRRLFAFLLAAVCLGIAGALQSCIYMDARTGCTESRVEVRYAVSDSAGVSMAPSLDYHREGTGATATNSAKQDGKIEPKTDLTVPLLK